MYIEQAYKGDNTLWKVIFTSLLVTGVFIVGMISYLFTNPEDLEKAYELMKNIPTNLSLIINLAPFAFILIVLFLLVKFFHHRSILSLTTSRPKVDYKRIIFSFLLVLIYTIGSFVIAYYATPEDYVLQFDLLNFSILLVIGLILFPFQIGLEEYVFRGFLMQQIGIVIKNRWFPLFFTSVFFGLAHSANPEVAKMGFGIMGFYIGTGLLLGIMTLMDEGLELALGFHFGNNLLAATLVTADYAALTTDAIFKVSSETEPVLWEMLIPMLIVYPIFLIIMAKKYNWTNWKGKLFGSVLPPEVIENTLDSIDPKNSDFLEKDKNLM